MPKVTSLPVGRERRRRGRAPAETQRRRAPRDRRAATSSIASGSIRRAPAGRPARPPGAVLRPTGSSRMAPACISSVRSCSATRKRCASLHTTIGRARPSMPGEARGRFLQHGLPAGQRQQLLRIQLARQRPQARAGAAGEDHGNQRHVHALTLTACRGRSHSS